MFFKELASAFIRGTVTTKLLFPKLFKKKKHDDDDENVPKISSQIQYEENTESAPSVQMKQSLPSFPSVPSTSTIKNHKRKPISFFITQVPLETKECKQKTNDDMHGTNEHVQINNNNEHVQMNEQLIQNKSQGIDEINMFNDQEQKELVIDEKDYDLYDIETTKPKEIEKKQKEKICFQQPLENQILCQIANSSSSYPFVLLTIRDENLYTLMKHFECTFYLTCSHSGPLYIDETITLNETNVVFNQKGRHCIGSIQFFDDTEDYHHELLLLCDQ